MIYVIILILIVIWYYRSTLSMDKSLPFKQTATTQKQRLLLAMSPKVLFIIYINDIRDAFKNCKQVALQIHGVQTIHGTSISGIWSRE